MYRPRSRPEIQIVANVEDLALAAALHFVDQGKRAIDEKNLFTVALSSDSISAAVYSRLADDSALNRQLSWNAVHFFCAAARHVEWGKAPRQDQPACEKILKKLPLAPVNVHCIKARYLSARGAAADYERQLRKFFALKPGQLPRFDLVLLGMGVDGHAAWLYPGSKALRESKRLVIAHRLDATDDHGITMSLPVLNNAEGIIFIVSGEDKAGIAREVLDGEYRPHHYPAQIIETRNGKTLWLMDKAAARLLRDDLRMS